MLKPDMLVTGTTAFFENDFLLLKRRWDVL